MNYMIHKKISAFILSFFMVFIIVSVLCYIIMGMLIGFDAFIKSLLSLLPLMISIELSELILKTKLKSPYGTRMHYLNPILLFLASLIIPFFIIATQEVFFLLFSSSILMSFLAPFFTIELDSFLEENFPYNYIVKNERINKLFISSLLTSAIIIVIVTFLIS